MYCAFIAPLVSARPAWPKWSPRLREQGAMDYTVVVVTEGNDPPGLAYVAPYAADQHRGVFMAQGRDVLVV